MTLGYVRENTRLHMAGSTHRGTDYKPEDTAGTQKAEKPKEQTFVTVSKRHAGMKAWGFAETLLKNPDLHIARRWIYVVLSHYTCTICCNRNRNPSIADLMYSFFFSVNIFMEL